MLLLAVSALGALYFLVAAGFTLIFGLMHVVNLAHGSLYLISGYLGCEIAIVSVHSCWHSRLSSSSSPVIGLLLRRFIFSKMEGEAPTEHWSASVSRSCSRTSCCGGGAGAIYSILAPQFYLPEGTMEFAPCRRPSARSTGVVTQVCAIRRCTCWILVAAICVIGVAV